MLQYSTVEPGTLDLLKRLMALPELADFYLVGGTVLALYRGHRLSVDLDLFAVSDFDTSQLVKILEKNFDSFSYSNPHNPVGIFSFINDIKVDFIRHHNFKLISSATLVEGVRLIGIPDIIAMKINAVMQRAVKKDFWDIAELLEDHTVEQFIAAYNEMYPNQQLLISVPQAMIYFADAEQSEDPVSLKGQTWEGVKRVIQQKVNEYLV